MEGKKRFLLLFFSFLHACIAQKYQCTDNEHTLFFWTLSRHTLHAFTYCIVLDIYDSQIVKGIF